jgi:hypothetical protein
MRGTHLRWGSAGSAVDATGETAGSLVEAILFFDYLFVWSLAMAVYVGALVVAGALALLLLLVCLPCFLWRKVFPKDKSQRPGHHPKARPVHLG